MIFVVKLSVVKLHDKLTPAVMFHERCARDRLDVADGKTRRHSRRLSFHAL